MYNKFPAIIVVLLAALAVTIAPSSKALAHDVEKGPNGGPMMESKGYHLELTVKGGEIVVFLSDKDHAPLASKGTSGQAVLLVGGKQQTVKLAPAEPNLLKAQADGPVGPGARVVVSAKLAGGQDLLARFALK